jgi:hypothetical protein
MSGVISGIRQIFLSTKKTTVPSSFFVLGNKAAAKQLQTLTVTGFGDEALLEQKLTATDAVIVCEGENFSFKELIAFTQKHGSKLLVCVHAHTSKSMVGSNSKNKTGFTAEV